MNWLRANYDRVAVLAGALFLLLCAFFIWRAAAGFNESFAGSLNAGAPKPAAPTAKALELQAAAQKLARPARWNFNSRSGLFVPEKHFIGPGGVPATLQTAEVHPPVPNEWLDQFSLPIADADVLTQDPDGDGFTNLEEWQGHTDPNEKGSHPPFIAKLKLKTFAREPFPLVFAATPGEGVFQLNYVDPKTPTGPDGKARIDPSKEMLLVKLGEAIQRYDPAQRKMVSIGFRVVEFKQKFQANRKGGSVEGGEIDVSELTIENTGTKQRLILVKERPLVSPEALGAFVYNGREPQEFTLKKGQEFSLPPQPEIKYKLIDVQPDKAVIVDTQKPEERIEVGPLTSE